MDTSGDGGIGRLNEEATSVSFTIRNDERNRTAFLRVPGGRTGPQLLARGQVPPSTT